MKDLRTIILAAGKGVRMKSDLPKVLHQVCGKPSIRYVLDVAKSVGSLKIFVVAGYKSNLVKKELGKAANIIIQKKLLGTGDAIKNCADAFRGYKGDVLVLCGDTPLLRRETVANLVRKHKSTKAACTFLTARVENPKGYGRIVRSGAKQVLAIREELDASDAEREINEINTGVYCFEAQGLFRAIKEIKPDNNKKEFYITDTIELFLNEGKSVETVLTDDPKEGLGINTREDLSTAQAAIRYRILKGFMESGVTIEDPATTHIDRGVKIGRDTVIRPFTVIEENVSIGNKCVIGPFCHLRPGTRIGNKIQIGNFTEVSRTVIEEGTLVKHFSFLGDASIGRNVNIGAGTVTANYDGKKKNKTKISDGAFIGSDSILVAPLVVGKKAMTGAGSVVTRGTRIPDGGIAVGVPARIRTRRK